MYFTRLKDLREDHELKQENVAILLKITRQQYGLYETGKRELFHLTVSEYDTID